MDIPARIVEKKQVADGVMKVTLALDGAPFDFQPGQYVHVRVPELKYPDPRGPERDFTISCPPNGKAITITFRSGEYASGFKQTLLSMPLGAKVFISGPYGDMILPKDPSRPLIFIAGGIGITGFRAKIKHVLATPVQADLPTGQAGDPSAQRHITLIWCATNERNIPYLWELRALAHEHKDRFTLVEIFGKRITADILKDLLHRDGVRLLWQIAGPPEMVQTMRDMLSDLKVNESDIVSEAFTGYESRAGSPAPEPALGDTKRLTEATSNNIPLYHGLLNALNTAAIVSKTDMQGRITYVNDRFVEISGYTREELVGQNHRILKSGAHAPNFYREIWSNISNGRIWRGEIKNRAKDGSYYWVDTSIAPVYDENGTPDGYISVRFLITDRKVAEEQLNVYSAGLEEIVKERTAAISEANADLKAEALRRTKLEQKLRMHMQELTESDRKKDEFIAILGHELRNPLSQIVTTAEVARLDMPTDHPDLGKHLDTIERQSYMMKRLLDDLLDVTRILRGKITLRPELVNIAEIMRHAVEGIERESRTTRHTFTVDIPDNLLIYADPVRLEQIFMNLVNNAVKYSPDGGEISISVRQDGTHARITIKDSGIGITATELVNIFGLFSQIDTPILFPQEKAGLGIGLYISKTLVEMHGGTIAVESEGRGHGATFIISLPLLPDEVPASETHPAPETSSRAVGKDRRIMVIDDIAELADAIGMLLSRMGYDVRVGYGGADAIAIAKDYAPDIVFLDIGMPYMDGYETLKELKKIPGLAHTRFFAVSGFGQEHDHRRSIEEGFTAHLVKPLGANDLREVLAKA